MSITTETTQQTGETPGSPSPFQGLATGLRGFWGEKKNRLLLAMVGVFLLAYFVPWSAPRVSGAVQEGF
ncbi:MAG: hypothetical protein ACOCYB_06000, partial [Alkalispirochaeta sp.]